MIVDGKPVFESMPVAEFLEDKYPDSGNRIMPVGAQHPPPRQESLLKHHLSPMFLTVYHSLAVRRSSFRHNHSLQRSLTRTSLDLIH